MSIINLKMFDLINIVSIYIHFPQIRRFEGFRHVPELFHLQKLHLLQYTVCQKTVFFKKKIADV